MTIVIQHKHFALLCTGLCLLTSATTILFAGLFGWAYAADNATDDKGTLWDVSGHGSCSKSSITVSLNDSITWSQWPAPPRLFHMNSSKVPVTFPQFVNKNAIVMTLSVANGMIVWDVSPTPFRVIDMNKVSDTQYIIYTDRDIHNSDIPCHFTLDGTDFCQGDCSSESPGTAYEKCMNTNWCYKCNAAQYDAYGNFIPKDWSC